MTPHRILELGEKTLELVATLRAFQLFKAKTAELGMGEPLTPGGKPGGLSILRGDLHGLDEVTIPVLVWALSHGEHNAGQETGYPTLQDVEELLQNPVAIMRALEEVAELVEEAVGGEDDSDRNQDGDSEGNPPEEDQTKT